MLRTSISDVKGWKAKSEARSAIQSLPFLATFLFSRISGRDHRRPVINTVATLINSGSTTDAAASSNVEAEEDEVAETVMAQIITRANDNNSINILSNNDNNAEVEALAAATAEAGTAAEAEADAALLISRIGINSWRMNAINWRNARLSKKLYRSH